MPALVLGALSVSWLSAACTLFVLGFVYTILLAVYRLTFSPLSAFPGSKIAAATGWYEFYYDVVGQGSYYRKIAEMHDKYGPIIRINPWELDVSDPAFHPTLFVSGSVRRSEIFAGSRGGLGIEGSHTVSEDHDLHRIRRKPVEYFFSHQKVQSYESEIADEVRLLDSRFRAMKGTGSIVRMEHVYAALTGDLIRHFSVINPPSLISDPEFSPNWYGTLRRFFIQVVLYTQLTFLVGWVRYIPRSILLSCTPNAAAFKAFTDLVIDHIEEARVRVKDGKLDKDTRFSTLIECLLTSDIPEEEKTTQRLTGEIITALSGGTMTTAHTLATITYHVLADPSIGEQLRQSLAPIMRDFPEKMPRSADIENIPYVAGCVKEGLRLSQSVMRRMTRCFPDVELEYEQWKIPKMTPIGMSAYIMHNDENVYPEPLRFRPERWLGDYDPLMKRNFVPFSKGSRSCLGMHLAYAELFLAVAVMFHPGGPKMSLYETDETDIAPVHDYFLALPKLDTKGVRVMVN
ncbi:hypothetical protein DCS_00079 [Drechmeria coniospora]|uniref:Cytochrome P450 n=1 Tax=Drechmeria coniospora TaxID=98403 RepID=A0A151GPM4_DRECN|nr:hypothetical protein DCS_00079 [Drechmeria coniospora]KYK58952.1 hypothetical protein DCS_00079 [Drechmeria coniospora]ODA76425.1 hypothetical protein RJ55_07694 [Drechmeria coniospora]